MKKILAITIYSITMIILFISFYIFGEVYFKNTFLNNSVEINVSGVLPSSKNNEIIQDDEIIYKIKELAKKIMLQYQGIYM